MNRRVQNCALRNVHEGAIFEKRSIERGEGVALHVQIAAEVGLDGLRLGRDQRGKAPDAYAFC